MRKLTIGMATYDDFDGLYFTVQSIRLYHPEVLADIEFLILDNNPEGEHGKAVERLSKWVKEPIRYVPVTDIRGTALRTRIFEMAETPYVLCMDCHVMLAPGSLAKLIRGFDKGWDEGNLLQGPMLYDSITVATHMAQVWRAGMWGIWAVAWRCPCGAVFQAIKEEGDDLKIASFQTMSVPHQNITTCQCGAPFPNGLSWEGHEKHLETAGYVCAAEGEPFEIPAHGMGLFACRKDAWLGFNPAFRGFGGEEVYIHQKYRRAGKRTICLPFLRWLHRFERPDGISYPASWEDRIRNYLLGCRELGLDVEPVLHHFAAFLGKKLVVTWSDEIEVALLN